MMKLTKTFTGSLFVSVFLFATQSSAQDVEWQLSESDVGVGTGSPQAKLHVEDNEYAYKTPLIVENTSGIGYSGFRLKIARDSFIDFNNAGGKFRINADQKPGAEFEVRPNGSASLSGSLSQNSDRNSKQNINNFDNKEVLEKVVVLPLSTWEYKSNSGVTHLGPMAQDFHAAFGLGESPTSISTIDTGGVALAAIQGLNEKVEAIITENEILKAQNRALKNRLNKIVAEQEEKTIDIELVIAEILRRQSEIVQVSSLD